MDERRDAPAVWPVVAVFFGALAAVLASTAALVFAVARSRGAGGAVRSEAQRFASSAEGIITSALVSDAVLLASALAAAATYARLHPRRGIRERLGLGPTRATRKDIVLTTAGLLGLSIACSGVGELAGRLHGSTLDAIERAMASPSPGRFVMEIAALALVPAVAEEVFFRGMLQGHVAARWGRRPAIVVAAIAFGVFHLDPVQGASAFAAGLFLGWAADRFGGIRPTAWAHAVNNAAFLALAAFSRHAATRSTPSRALALGAAVAAGLLVCAAALRAVDRTAPLPPFETPA